MLSSRLFGKFDGRDRGNFKKATNPTAGHPLWLIVGLVAAVLSRVPTASAQPFQVVEDRVTTESQLTPNISGVTRAVNGVFMSLRSRHEGQELWYLPDGDSNVRLVADLNPIGSGMTPYNFPPQMIAFGDGVLFGGATRMNLIDLWYSDGSPAGTRLVKELSPQQANNPKQFTKHGNKVYFSAQGSLWVTDGTTAGTIKLVDNVEPWHLTPTPRGLFFTGLDSRGRELWLTDGTPEGTRLVIDLRPGALDADPSWLTYWNDRLYFSGVADVNGGAVIWSTDGSAAGTTLLISLYPEGSANNRLFTPYNGRLYFCGVTSGGDHLFSTDGTTAGTGIAVAGLRVKNMTAVGPRLLIFGALPFSPYYMVLSDGTENGTQFIEPVIAEEYYPSEFQRVGDRVGFPLFGPRLGYEFWTSDGTPQGTAPYADIVPGNDPHGYEAWLQPDGLIVSIPSAVLGGQFPFRFLSSTQALEPITGYEQRADGDFVSLAASKDRDLYFVVNESRSRLVRKTSGGLPMTVATFDSSDLDGVTPWLVPFNDGLMLGANKLWSVLDSGRTEIIGPLTPEFPLVDSAGLFFSANGASGGFEPWFSNGSSAVRLANLATGTASSFPQGFVSTQGTSYFSAAANPGGRELFATRGTPETTRRVIDLAPGSASGVSSVSSSPQVPRLGILDGRVLFPGSTSGSNYELWQSNGEAAGTSLLAEIVPGGNSSTPNTFVSIGRATYFLNSNLKTVYRVIAGRAPEVVFVAQGETAVRRMVATGGTLFILSGPPTDANRPAGPTLLSAVLDPSFPASFVANVSLSGARYGPRSEIIPVGETGWVALAADTLETGQELMLSRGLTAESGGTRIVDITPGPGSSSIQMIQATLDSIYLNASDGIHGLELLRASLADLSIARPCAADFNRDGFVDFFDYSDFVECFETGQCPMARTADVNNDDFVDFFDYLDYVASFEGPC